jgi:hypothetical protein
MTIRHHWLSAIAVTLAASVAVEAAPPLPLEKVIGADDLVAEAAAKGAQIEPFLASAEAYQQNADKLKASASLLAVIGQALAEHPQDSKLKAAGPSLRDAAIALARSENYDDAKSAWPKVQAALAGKADGKVPVDFDWAKLSKMHPAMEEMNARSSQLRRLLRRPKDAAVDSRHASAIALLAVTAYADTHEVKNPADLPQWRELATALQQHMSAAAAAIKAKDTMQATQRFQAGMETCTKCHDAFQTQ